MLSPTDNHSDVCLGVVGTFATALTEAAGAPSFVTKLTGVLTAVYIGLKIIGWFIDRFSKNKKKDQP